MTIGMVSGSGTFRRTSIVAMALFLQYWYWFPMAYILPLSFKCTALIGVTKELKLPKFSVSCNCRKGLHAYAKPVVDNAKKKVRPFAQFDESSAVHTCPLECVSNTCLQVSTHIYSTVVPRATCWQQSAFRYPLSASIRLRCKRH